MINLKIYIILHSTGGIGSAILEKLYKRGNIITGTKKEKLT